jgi:hypothetical protein
MAENLHTNNKLIGTSKEGLNDLDEEYQDAKLAKKDIKKEEEKASKSMSPEEKLAKFELKKKLVEIITDWSGDTTCKLNYKYRF